MPHIPVDADRKFAKQWSASSVALAEVPNRVPIVRGI